MGFLLLAQTDVPSPVDLPQIGLPQVDPQAVQSWLDQANAFLADLPNLIDRIDLLVAVLLVPFGLVTLLYGFRIVKAVAILYCAIGGAGAGWYLMTEIIQRPDLWWVGLLVGGVLAALLAWPLANFFIGMYGAVAGGLAGFAVTHAVGDQRAMLIGVGIGVVVGGLLAALIFRFMVVVMTSVLGATMTTVGIIAMLYRVEQVAEPLRTSLNERHYLLPLLMAVPAVAGMVYQLYRTESREAKEDGDSGEKE